MKLRWTPHSRADLRAIHAYIARDSPANAIRMIDRLTRRAEQFMAFPLSGRVVPEFQREDIREVIEPPYRIIYRVLSDRIDVLTVMHGARILRKIPGLGAP
jgi:addiction module RelE/StbE family toxin